MARIGGAAPTVNIAGSGTGTMTGSIALTLSTDTLNYNVTGALTNSGNISGAGNLTNNGTGTVTLTGGANINYTGGTTINAGRLILSNASAYNSPTTINTGGKMSWTGTTTVQNNNTADTIALNNGGTLADINPSNWVVLLGAVTNSGSGTITISSNATGSATEGFFMDGGLKGTGTVTINATNAGSGVNFRNNNSTFSGLMIVNGIASTTVFSGSGIGVGGNTTGLQNADIQLNGTMELLTGGLGWANAGSGAFKMGALSGTGVMVGNFTGGGTTTVTVGNTNNSGNFSGIIANGTGNTVVLIKTGTGTQTLSGSNTYTGNTTVSGGVLQIGGSGSLGSGNYAGAIADTATLEYSSSAAQTLSGIISGTNGALIKDTSTSTLTLTGVNTYTGGTTISNGMLRIGDGTTNGSATGTYAIAGGATLKYNYNTSGGTTPVWANISGAGTLELATAKNFDTGSWAGTTTALPNTFTGILQIDSGRLPLGSGASSGLGGTSSVVIQNGGQIALYNLNSGIVISQPFTIAGTGYGETNYESAIRFQSGGSQTLSGSMTLSASATIGSSGGTGIVSGVISGGNTATLTLGTAGETSTILFTGSNTYTGATVIHNGTLQIGDGTTGHDGTMASSSITDNTALSYNTFSTQSYAGVISGGGSLTKNGGGTLTLSGSNTYTGTTTVSGGVLAYTGTNTITGSVQATGGTLSVSGSLNNLAGNFYIAPAGGLILNGGSIIDSASTNYSSGAGFNLNGNINISSGTLTRSSGSNWSALGVFGPTTWTQTGGTVTLNGQGVDGGHICHHGQHQRRNIRACRLLGIGH